MEWTATLSAKWTFDIATADWLVGENLMVD